MYALVRRYLKTSLAFLALGLLQGFYMLLGQRLGWPWPAGIVAAHTHVLLFGFVFMMIMGVAFWMFPRPGEGEVTSYTPGLAEVAYWFVTVGTALRFAGDTLWGVVTLPGYAWVSPLGGVGQVIGAGLFIYGIRGRILPKGYRNRDLRGDRF